MTGPILITGANGFVGQALVQALADDGRPLRLAVRTGLPLVPDGTEQFAIGDLDRPLDWTRIVAGCSAVIHCAGLAHADAPLPDALYQAVNTDATLALAAAARDAGVGRFVFLSSIRAMSGPSSLHPLRDGDIPAPTDAYGRSKLAAERGLAALDLDWIALRPVLIHGPGVKANMAALMRLAASPWPLPFGALSAQRSLLALDNLVSAVRFTLDADLPLRRSYVLADPEPVTLGEMIGAMRAGLGRPPGLLPVPEALMRAGLSLVGRKGLAERLTGGLVARPTDLVAAGWRPATDTLTALRELMRSAPR
jgi:UDP-glucose 4-epimerase